MIDKSASGVFWLASYPKSGNTWLRLALESLRAGGARVDLTSSAADEAPIASHRRLFDTMLEVSSSDLTAEEIEELRPRAYELLSLTSQKALLCKVHDAWTRTASGEPIFPQPVTLGAIYIVRDPRDVAISCAHYFGITLDESIDRLADPDFKLAKMGEKLLDQVPHSLLGWSGHVASWLDAPGMPPFLVRYEDMVADFQTELSRIADYLGWTVTHEAVAQAVEATRFEVLRAAETRQGFGGRPARASGYFFRRGVAGGWRDTLTSDQVECIESKHGPMMSRLGYLQG